MKRFKKVVVLTMTALMVMTNVALNAMAADVNVGDIYYEDMEGIPTEDGTYRVQSTIYKNNLSRPQIDSGFSQSLTDMYVAEYVYVTISGENVILDFYVQADHTSMLSGKECMFEKFTITYDGADYEPTLSLSDTFEVDFFRQTDAEAVSHKAHKYSFTLPVSALQSEYVDAYIEINTALASYSNGDMDIIMMHYQYETIATSNMSTQETQVTATVVKIDSTYSVRIPESISVGELSETELVYTTFDIDVNINAGNDGLRVILKTDRYGELSNGKDVIEFESYLGRSSSGHYVSDTSTVSSELYFYAKDVAGKSAGEYAGTMIFDISSDVQ